MTVLEAEGRKYRVRNFRREDFIEGGSGAIRAHALRVIIEMNVRYKRVR